MGLALAGSSLSPPLLGRLFVVQPPASGEGERSLHAAISTLAALGIPVSMSKLEGPGTCVTFLGIVIDTIRFQLRLPEDKLIRIRSIVASWIGRRSGRRSNMESLLGHLSLLYDQVGYF